MVTEEGVGEVELWGFHGEDVESVRRLVEKELGIRFALHESEGIGPYYLASFCFPHAELTLRPNFDPMSDSDDPDEELAEPDFPDYGVLLYVEWRTADDDCRARFARLGVEAQLLAVE